MLFWGFFTNIQIKVLPEKQPNGYSITVTGEDGSNISRDDIIQSGPYDSYIFVELKGNFNEIGREAFRLCSKLQKAILTNVRFIRYAAFAEIKMTEINYGNTLELIEDYATTYLQCLSIYLPKTLKTISSKAFDHSKFKTIEFEADGSLASIGVAAFDSVPISQIINLPQTLKVISCDAFLSSTLMTFSIPSSVTSFAGAFRSINPTITLSDPATSNFVIHTDGLIYSKNFQKLFYYPQNLSTAVLHLDCVEIEPYVFSMSSVSSIQLPPAILRLESELFAQCKNLTIISLPHSIIEIKSNCFKGCGLIGEFLLPNNLSKIGSGAFAECKGITKMRVEANENYFTDENGVLYDMAITSIIWFPPNKFDYEMPDTILSIQESLFSGCNLNSIKFSTKLVGIYNYAFSNNNFTYLYFPKSIKNIHNIVFSGNPYLRKVEFENNSQCKTLGNWCFPPSIEELILGDNCSLETLGMGTFTSNPFFKTFDFPPTMISIGKDAFNGCRNLENVTFCSNVNIGVGVFSGCTRLNLIKLDMASVGTQSFANSGVETIELTNKIKIINSGAFAKCPRLKNVVFNEGNEIESIFPLAFGYCNSLESITIPWTIKNITASSFGYCEKLTSIIITTTGSDEELFESINGIVYTSNKVINAGKPKTLIAFPSGKEEADIEKDTIVLGAQAFDSCGRLKSIHFNAELEEISNHCFSNCISLKSINIPRDIMRIGKSPFDGCSALSDVFFCGNGSKTITIEEGEIIPVKSNVYVNNDYIKDTFAGHTVIKSTSKDNDGCPNIPTSGFSLIKKKSSRKKIVGLFIGRFLLMNNYY